MGDVLLTSLTRDSSGPGKQPPEVALACLLPVRTLGLVPDPCWLDLGRGWSCGHQLIQLFSSFRATPQG